MITHSEPGTTRDAIDDMISINGIPLTIVDTAGIRETEHEVERLGIMESRKQLRQADKIIMVFDNSKPLEREDRDLIEYIYKLGLDKTDSTHKISIIPVINKADLPCRLDRLILTGKIFEPLCKISALNGDGLTTLEERLVSEFDDYTDYTPERPVVFTRRQQDYLSKALQISKCIQSVKEENDNYSTLLKDIRQNLLNCIVLP